MKCLTDLQKMYVVWRPIVLPPYRGLVGQTIAFCGLSRAKRNGGLTDDTNRSSVPPLI